MGPNAKIFHRIKAQVRLGVSLIPHAKERITDHHGALFDDFPPLSSHEIVHANSLHVSKELICRWTIDTHREAQHCRRSFRNLLQLTYPC